MGTGFHVVVTVIALGLAAPLCAQCTNPWVAFGGADSGVNGSVTAIQEWDPDGAGPRGPVLVVGGNFTVAGNANVGGIAQLDLATGQWSSLGGGLWQTFGAGAAQAFAVMPNNDLVVGGAFVRAGQQNVQNIARWDGSTWSALGRGLSDGVRALTVDRSGNLIAGGSFTYAGGWSAHHVARWDGVAWSGLGAGNPADVVSLAVLPNGDIVAASQNYLNAVRRWNGTSWSSMGGSFFVWAHSLAVLPNGDLYAFGDTATTPRVVAKWQGTWAAVGTAVGSTGILGGRTLLARATGELLVAGDFTGIGGVTGSVAQFDGTSWVAQTGLIGGRIWALAELSGSGTIVAGGAFSVPGTPRSTGIARWSGGAWSELGAGAYRGADRAVFALVELPGGGLACGGFFDAVGGIAARRVAAFDGVGWSDLGGGLDGSSDYVNALAVLRNGDLVAAGRFGRVAGVAADNIARWDGSTWHPLAGGITHAAGIGEVHTLTTLPNGHLVAGGSFDSAGGAPASNIARWDGVAWTPLGAGVDGTVAALAVRANGDLVAGGSFRRAGGLLVERVARWDGSSWWPLGAGFGGYQGVSGLGVMPAGDIVAVGGLYQYGVTGSHVARWDGSAWTIYGSGLDSTAETVLVLPDGDVLVGGWFAAAGGVPAHRIARWDGAAWSAFGNGLVSGSAITVYALAGPTVAGDVLVGGSFNLADLRPSQNLAMLSTTCRAGAAAVGTGCSGPAGPMQLTVAAQPWIGGTFRSGCTGIAANGIALGLLGLTSPAIPLAVVHPTGGAGCDLLAGQELRLALLFPTGSVAVTEFVMPVDPSFAGVVLQHQVVQVVLGAGPTVQGLASSNGLALTLGAF